MAKVEDCPGFETFGADVRAGREAQGITRKALAEEVNIAPRYRKKTGEFFLHGVGGAMTVYGCPDNGGWTGGEDIIPIGDLEAKEWAEAHCDVDTYIELFGPVEE